MRIRARQLYMAALLALPVIVAARGWSVTAAVLAIIVLLLWRWAIALVGMARAPASPSMTLDTISASHFVEKVRWNLDLTGLPYTERASAGTLGAFFLGRTVPRLRFTTGRVESSLGNSAEILRYLWGAHAAREPAAVRHLEPTPARLEFEAELDRYGRDLQVWVYHHVLDERDLCLKAWGANDPAVPVWQRWLLRPLYPLLTLLIRRSFRISSDSYQRACSRIEVLLEKVDTLLSDGRASILGGVAQNYTDYAFAAMCGLWLQPSQYGGPNGKAVHLARSSLPAPMRADVERWSEDYPRTVEWVRALYETRSAPDELAGADD
jgi:hypothetical protein